MNRDGRDQDRLDYAPGDYADAHEESDGECEWDEVIEDDDTLPLFTDDVGPPTP